VHQRAHRRSLVRHGRPDAHHQLQETGKRVPRDLGGGGGEHSGGFGFVGELTDRSRCRRE
jgi:hypothetical protein